MAGILLMPLITNDMLRASSFEIHSSIVLTDRGAAAEIETRDGAWARQKMRQGVSRFARMHRSSLHSAKSQGNNYVIHRG
jgi:hypothetical protein